MPDNRDNGAEAPHPTSNIRPSTMPSANPTATAPYRRMMHVPQPSPYHAELAITTLGDAYYDIVKAADFPTTILRFRNDRWAATVGLDSLTDEEWLNHFGRFQPLPGNLPEPLALRYHGHQF